MAGQYFQRVRGHRNLGYMYQDVPCENGKTGVKSILIGFSFSFFIQTCLCLINASFICQPFSSLSVHSYLVD